MVSLRPTSSAQNAIGHIDALLSKATAVRGSSVHPLDAFKAYLAWSIEALRSLSAVLDGEDVISVLQTTGFRLIHAANSGTYPSGVLGELVAYELDEQIRVLTALKMSLRSDMERWEFQGALTLAPTLHIGVVDTNVLMLFSEDLHARDWNEPLDVRRGEKIAIVIPEAVVRELDTLKRSTGTMNVDGQKVERRTLARRALRAINTAFPGRDTTCVLRGSRDAEHTVVSSVKLILHLNNLRHPALPDADAEIIDRALALEPWGKSVSLLTGDSSMRFRAQHAGLRAVELDGMSRA